MSFTMTVGPDRHSLQILNQLYEYDDFMSSVSSLADLGCGDGDDLAWWATATTRDESAQPLNIRCVGVDLLPQLPMAKKHVNVTYQRSNFENSVQKGKTGFDVLWCHDAFQYAINPIDTLAHWRDIVTDTGMLMISVPQTVKLQKHQLAPGLKSGCYYHHTMVSLIYMLATTGWDCRSGFFQQLPTDPWTTVIAYNSNQSAREPRSTSWYDLVESGLLPESADKSIKAHGYLEQQDLVVPWLDKSLSWMGKQ